MDKNEKRRDIIDAELHRRVEEVSREVGISPHDLVREAVEEFAESRNPPESAVPETALGKRLRAFRARIVRSGAPLLGAAELDRELAEGRRDRGNK